MSRAPHNENMGTKEDDEKINTKCFHSDNDHIKDLEELTNNMTQCTEAFEIGNNRSKKNMVLIKKAIQQRIQHKTVY